MCFEFYSLAICGKKNNNNLTKGIKAQLLQDFFKLNHMLNTNMYQDNQTDYTKKKNSHEECVSYTWHFKFP